MKFNQIILITILLFSSFICFSSEYSHIDLFKFSPIDLSENASLLKKIKFKVQLSNMKDIWGNYNSKKRITLDPKIYNSISEKFSSHQNTTNNKIEINNQCIQSTSIRTISKINRQKECELLIGLAEIHQEILKQEKFYQGLKSYNNALGAIIKLNSFINNKNKSSHKKNGQNIVQSPITAQSNNKQTKQTTSIPKQLYNARKILLDEYNVKDEIELKQNLLEHAIEYENQNISNFISDTITNTNCFFIFCGKCQIFKIFHNTVKYDTSFCNNCLKTIQNKKKRNKESLNTTSSSDGLKTNAITLPQ